MGPGKKEVAYFQKDRVRVEMPDSVQVMNFQSRKIIWIDKEEKTYSVMTFDEFKQMVRENMKAVNQAMEEMKRRGISMPGAVSRPARRFEVHKLPGATIAGYPSDGYQISEGGRVTEEIWTTKKIDLSREVDPAIYREFEELSRESSQMMQGAGEVEQDPALKKVYESGYVMKTVYKETGDVDQVTRAERKSLSESLFTEPKGYKKVPPAIRGISRGGEMPESGGVGGQAADYGKQTTEEAKDAASRGAQEPVQEKKREGLDSIRKGASEGIKKLFKW
ncbi:MAG: DUF4412 domain-containing protein [Candidatus Deferrimicrobiaceae bacterium]